MIRRIALYSLVAALALVLAACNDDPDPDTTKDTLADPLGDIVALEGSLYATNHDRSGNAGSQIDLFEFATDGFPIDRHDLGLNHMGYLAAATDGAFIYLQSRDTGQLFKVSPVGEVAWTRADTYTGGNVLACGLAYHAAEDSFTVVYHESGTASYTTLTYGPGLDGPATERQHEWSTFDPDRGVIAVAWADDWLWALGPNHAGTLVLEGFRDDGAATRFIPLADDSACGLTADGDTLWVAYTDRRFEAIDLDAGTP